MDDVRSRSLHFPVSSKSEYGFGGSAPFNFALGVTYVVLAYVTVVLLSAPFEMRIFMLARVLTYVLLAIVAAVLILYNRKRMKEPINVGGDVHRTYYWQGIGMASCVGAGMIRWFL
jgi:hypothetical protein